MQRCNGTIEAHNSIDVREMIRRGMLDHPVGTTWQQCALRWPWITAIRLDQASLQLRLRSGRFVVVPLTWARCGAVGNRLRLVCPCCRRRVCKLYEIGGTCRCRVCGNLWYACQRRSANGRRCLKAQRLRFKLGGPAALKLLDGLDPDTFPPRPRGMHRRTYE